MSRGFAKNLARFFGCWFGASMVRIGFLIYDHKLTHRLALGGMIELSATLALFVGLHWIARQASGDAVKRTFVQQLFLGLNRR